MNSASTLNGTLQEHRRIKPDPDQAPQMNNFHTSFPEGPTSPVTPAQATAGSSTVSVHDTISTPSNFSLRNSASLPPMREPSVGEFNNMNFKAMGSSRTLVGRNSTNSTGYEMLGEDMRDMVNTINQMRMKGVEDLGLPLPRIAVIGNQSAGKSSLIEAISGIRVPRYSGTCTRCPLEITLTEDQEPNAPWNCKISLRFRKKYTKKPRGGDPWVDMPQEQFPFVRIDDPQHVEPSLIRAQLAILNPSKNWNEYVGKDVTLSHNDDLEVPFSPNVICMEITGSRLPNLSFIDLPGIIHVTERKEEEYLIKLVKNLVESYIKQEDCLILLAMTMKDDAVNQSAAQMARKFGPSRTIGALTKPDTVLGGEHEQWIRILRGQEHRLPHGYFVTKQPSQQELLLRISHAEARESEAQFFANTRPWSTELADLSDRFGTSNLQKYLSRQLANLIRLRLPAIIQKVQSQSLQVQAQLRMLPPPPAGDQRVVLRQLLDEYYYQVRSTIEARGDNNNEFCYQWRKAANRLKNDLIALRPRVNPDETAARSSNSPFTSRSNIYGSFSSSSPAASTPTKRKRPGSADDPPDEADPTNSPARKRQATEGRTPMKRVISLEDDDVVETESITDSPSQGFNSKPMHLYEIREVLETCITTHLPQTVDPKAVESIAKMHVRLWEGPIQAYIDRMDTLLHSHVNNLFAKTFARYENSPLYGEISEILESFHEIIMTKIRSMVTKCHNIEAECVYTLQSAEWSREILYWKEDNGKRRKRAIDENHLLKVQRLQEQHTARGKKGKVEVPPNDQNAPDPFQREIDTMTNAQAYCSIARKRFSDTVMMRMLRSAFTKYTHLGTFKEYIEQNLHLREMTEQDQERRCRELMVEDPQKEKERSMLMAKRDLLENACQDLEPFQMQGY